MLEVDLVDLTVHFITWSLTKRKMFIPQIAKLLRHMFLILSSLGLYSQSGVVRWKY